MSADDVAAARAQRAASMRRLVDAAMTAAMALDDPATGPHELDQAYLRVLDRVAAAKAAYTVHTAACRGYAKSTR